jgi:hypothetical protein
MGQLAMKGCLYDIAIKGTGMEGTERVVCSLHCEALLWTAGPLLHMLMHV